MGCVYMRAIDIFDSLFLLFCADQQLAVVPSLANASIPCQISHYHLEIGEARDSFAFAIARRFGQPEHVGARAEQGLQSFIS